MLTPSEIRPCLSYSSSSLSHSVNASYLAVGAKFFCGSEVRRQMAMQKKILALEMFRLSYRQGPILQFVSGHIDSEPSVLINGARVPGVIADCFCVF